MRGISSILESLDVSDVVKQDTWAFQLIPISVKIIDEKNVTLGRNVYILMESQRVSLS